jgi:hypothetical protein
VLRDVRGRTREQRDEGDDAQGLSRSSGRMEPASTKSCSVMKSPRWDSLQPARIAPVPDGRRVSRRAGPVERCLSIKRDPRRGHQSGGDRGLTQCE